MLHHTIDGAPTIRRVYSASPDRLLESEIRSFDDSTAPPELVQRDVTAWWRGIPVSVAFDEDTITLRGWADTAWLEANSVLPLGDRAGWFAIRVPDLSAVSGLRTVVSTSSWADESGEYGPYAVTGERLADFDPHPTEDLREVAWTRSDGGEHVGTVEWRRALGYFQNEPVDVLASNGGQLWVTVPDTNPLAARGERITDAPFTDLYRGRSALWLPRDQFGSVAPYTMTVEQQGPLQCTRGSYARVNGLWRPIDSTNAAVAGEHRLPRFVQTMSPLPEHPDDAFVFAFRAPTAADVFTSERTAPGTVRVDDAEVELAEPYSAWNGSDRLRVYTQDALEAVASDGFDRETSHLNGRPIATVRSFEIDY